MKIAAIAKVIKDRGSCRLYRVHGSDDLETKFYIGTNSEIYSLEGFPKPWSEAEVMTMLGIEKKEMGRCDIHRIRLQQHYGCLWSEPRRCCSE